MKPSEDEGLAALQRTFGAEVADQARRNHALMRDPRELTVAERDELRGVLAPILRDIRTSGAIPPDIREQARADEGPRVVCAWIEEADGSGTGIRVLLESSPDYRLADLAEQLQDWEIETLAAAGRSATWPECPSHRDSHPLSPGTRGGEGVWCCPVSGHVVSRIGAWPGP